MVMQSWKGATLWSLDPHRLNCVALCVTTHLVEEHGLAHTAESDHPDTLDGPPNPQPFQPNFHVHPYGSATGEFWRRAASPRSIGILTGSV